MEYYILGTSSKWLFGALEAITHTNINTVFSQESILLYLRISASRNAGKLDDYRIAKVTSDLSSYNLILRNPSADYGIWTVGDGDVRTMAHTDFITVKEFVNQRVSVVVRLDIFLELIDPTKWTKPDCIFVCNGVRAFNIQYCYQASCVTAEFQDELVDMVMPSIADMLRQNFRDTEFEHWLSKRHTVLQWLLKNVLKRKLFKYYETFYSQPGFPIENAIPVDHYDEMLRYDGKLIRFVPMIQRNIEIIKLAVASNPHALKFLSREERSTEITMIALRACALISGQAVINIVPYITCQPIKMIVDELYKAYHDEGESTVAIPTHVKSRLIEHAVEHGEICPISYEPLTRENTTVTPCGHLFSKNSLAMTDQSLCPTCRASISL